MALTKAKEEFDAKLLAIKTLLPNREVIPSITLHGEGSSKTFPMECVSGSLVGGRHANGVHRAERRGITYGLPLELFISDNQELAEFIEDKLNRYTKSLEKTDVNIKLLQIVEGNGGARALGPCRVGLNFIVFDEDGSFPLRGAIPGKNIPKGMPNKADLKPAAAPRAVKRKVSDNDEENSNTIDLTNESEDEDERD